MNKSEFIENEKYHINRDISVKELNKNNIMFNINHNTKSNIINHKLRQAIFTKSKDERKIVKEIKKELNSKAFNLVAKMKHQREVLITSIINSEQPNFNLELKILNK